MRSERTIGTTMKMYAVGVERKKIGKTSIGSKKSYGHLSFVCNRITGMVSRPPFVLAWFIREL